MDPTLGNVYNSDMNFVDLDDLLYISPLASTNTNAPWPITTVDPIPKHLVPGASFAAYHRSEPSEIHDTRNDCDFSSFYQPYHPDWTTEGTWDMVDMDQLVGQGYPFETSDSHSNLIGKMSLPDFPDPNNVFDTWMEPTLQVGSFDLSDSLMRESAVPERRPWDLWPMDLFELGFESFPQGVYEDFISDSTRMCGWCDNGSPCNAPYPPGDNLKRSISHHLHRAHNLLPSSGKSTQKCLWLGCAKELKQESIVRHILTVHLHVTKACKGCGTTFARQDSLQRHMKNSCRACKEG